MLYTCANTDPRPMGPSRPDKPLSQLRPDTLAIVPLRGGSKGLPGKNTRLLAGQPLYRYALDAAREAGIASVVISTDIEAVLATDHGTGVRAVRRPAELATDTTPMNAVLLHLLAQPEMKAGTVVLLQATSPLRRGEHIEAALDLYATGKHELVMSVVATDAGILKYGFVESGSFVPVNDVNYVFSNRQQLPPVYRPNGAIYVFDAQWFLQSGGFATGKIGAYVMTTDDSHDIDNADDFARCEQLLLARRNPVR